MLLLQSIDAEVVGIRIGGVLHVGDSRDVRAGEVSALGNAWRLRVRHARTRNGNPPDASNGGPGSCHLFNLGEHDHSHTKVKVGRLSQQP